MNLSNEISTNITTGTGLISEHDSNPIRYIDGEWGFWDETWSVWYGGLTSRTQAEAALSDYCRNVLGLD